MDRNLVLLETQSPGIMLRILYAFLIFVCISLSFSQGSLGVVAVSFIFIFLFIALFTIHSKLFYNKNTKNLETRYTTFGMEVYLQVEQIPEISYISLVSVVEHQKLGSRVTVVEFTTMKCNLNLIFVKNSNPRFKTIVTYEYEKALELAKIISDATGKKIHLTAGSTRKWVD